MQFPLPHANRVGRHVPGLQFQIKPRAPHPDPERNRIDVMVEFRREVLKGVVPILGDALVVTHESVARPEN
jgi:hypothetical protein